MRTTCCIVGGGPAGVMLGYLLARAGVVVTVLEKHKDFFRDFRGDTIHPSTMQLLNELGLLDRFLKLPHAKIERMTINIGGRAFPASDFTHLPVRERYIALMPQWDFLNFLSGEAARYPAFTLKMGWEATGLVRSGDRVTGVTVKTADGVEQGPQQIDAELVVGCDGRHAITRESAGMAVVEEGVPIDVLWMRLPRRDGDPRDALGYVNYGSAVILIDRNDYFQCGYLIAKGSLPELQAQGLAAFRASIERLVPFMAGRTGELDSWEKVKLLTVQINHLERWSMPGLLCIGDAAHAMSPAGGIGINIALQDAVAAANVLAGPLRAGSLTEDDVAKVEARRIKAVLRTQKMQAQAHGVLDRVLRNPEHHAGPLEAPLALRIATHVPGAQRLMGRFIGMGLQPEHVRSDFYSAMSQVKT